MQLTIFETVLFSIWLAIMIVGTIGLIVLGFYIMDDEPIIKQMFPIYWIGECISDYHDVNNLGKWIAVIFLSILLLPCCLIHLVVMGFTQLIILFCKLYVSVFKKK